MFQASISGAPALPAGADLLEHLLDVLALGVAVGMGDVADVDDEVGRDHFLQRRPEGGDELGRKLRDEADRVGQDRLVEAGQRDLAHRRVESREQQVLGHHVGVGEPVEQGRLAGIGVADQGDHRPGRALAAGAVQRAGAGDLLELLA